jgi:hypothetical protein
MNILDLHELRDGVSGAAHRLRRGFNPWIHLSEDDPLMRVLYSITRPMNGRVLKPKRAEVRNTSRRVFQTGRNAEAAPAAAAEAEQGAKKPG